MGHHGTPDRQLILQILCGLDDDDILQGTAALESKAKAKGVTSHTLTISPGNINTWKEQMPAGAPQFTAKSRIYLQGHGDWAIRSLGAATPEMIAGWLGEMQLPKDILISVLGCQLARDTSTVIYGLVGHSVDSFASDLHRLLRDNYKVETLVFARLYDVGVEPGGGDNERGSKVSYTAEPGQGIEGFEEDTQHKHSNSKVCYWWEDGKQRRGHANYVTRKFDRIEDY